MMRETKYSDYVTTPITLMRAVETMTTASSLHFFRFRSWIKTTRILADVAFYSLVAIFFFL